MNLISRIPYCLLAVFTTAILIVACSENKSKQPEQVTTAKESGKRTEVKITKEHVKVPNSKLYLIPPVDFVIDPTSGTLKKNHDDFGAHFLFMKIYSGQTVEQYLSEIKQSYTQQGGIFKEESLTVSGHSAVISQFAMEEVGQMWLYFTDGYTDEILVGNHNTSDTKTTRDMYEAMKTTMIETYD